MIADLDEKLNDRFNDVEAFPVDPDQGSHVSHVEMPLLVDELVEDAAKIHADTKQRTQSLGRVSSARTP